MNDLEPKNGSNVDSKCHSLTAKWITDKNKICEFYENSFEIQLPNGIYTLEDLKEFGINKKVCPYFLARKSFEVKIE